MGISALPIGKYCLRWSRQNSGFSFCFFCATVYDIGKYVMQNIYFFVGISKRANVCGFIYRAKRVVDLGSLSWFMVSLNAWMRFLGLYGLLKSCPATQVICVL